jgi:hypothetical protein
MARSRSRSSNSSSRSASSRKPSAAAEVEVVEESGGMGIDDGIPIITTVLLIGALLMVDYAIGIHYGAGFFFKQ